MIKHFSGSSVQMEITVPHNVQLHILMALGNPGKFASKLLFTYLSPSCTPQKCQKEGGAQPPPHPLPSLLALCPLLEYINRVYGIHTHTYRQCACTCGISLILPWDEALWLLWLLRLHSQVRNNNNKNRFRFRFPQRCVISISFSVFGFRIRVSFRSLVLLQSLLCFASILFFVFSPLCALFTSRFALSFSGFFHSRNA